MSKDPWLVEKFNSGTSTPLQWWQALRTKIATRLEYQRENGIPVTEVDEKLLQEAEKNIVRHVTRKIQESTND